MGLLSKGTPLNWDETKKYVRFIKEHGITQFLNVWAHSKSIQKDDLLWGDEVEGFLVSFDPQTKTVKASLRANEILELLGAESERAESEEQNSLLPLFHEEYGRFMIESTPGSPYPGTISDYLLVEKNMALRRSIISQYLREDERFMTLSALPMLGVGNFTIPAARPGGPVARSFFLPDDVINLHARFPTLTANIRERRQEKVAINIPIFFDTNTPKPFVDPTIPKDRNIYPEDANARDGAALDNHIYMDAMGFGMGCCCLQITFQTFDVNEARSLFDQLLPFTPIMMAITACSPIFRGYLADQDCRWNVIAGAVDDRTKEERKTIKKSRYESCSLYIANDERFFPEYNDIDVPKNEEIRTRLLNSNIDQRIADHISHLFIRDPLAIYSESLFIDDNTRNDHFECINTSNWQSMRFKPPPVNSPIGWRVEFRTMEIQFTDFENAAFAIFVVLCSRVILSFNLNLYMPISLIDENMKRAHERDACVNQKFWFRRNIFPQSSPTSQTFCNGEKEDLGKSKVDSKKVIKVGDGQFVEMTCDEIINGDETSNGQFPGFAKIITSYINSLEADIETQLALLKYVRLVSQRSSGQTKTGAAWIREFVRNHPDYKFDSVVSNSINYDLLRTIDQMASDPKDTEREKFLLLNCP